jgi:hypothetical protein
MIPASSGNEVIFRNLKHSKARKVRAPWFLVGFRMLFACGDISWHLWIQRIATACSKSSALHWTESLKTWTTDRISMASMVNLPWLGQPAVGFSASIARFSRGVYQSHCSWFQDAFEKTFLKCQEQLGWSAISIASFLGRTKRRLRSESRKFFQVPMMFLRWRQQSGQLQHDMPRRPQPTALGFNEISFSFHSSCGDLSMLCGCVRSSHQAILGLDQPTKSMNIIWIRYLDQQN